MIKQTGWQVEPRLRPKYFYQKAGGQNKDLIIFKLENRPVNQRLSRNSAFLLHFQRVDGILIPKQSTEKFGRHCLLIASGLKKSDKYSRLLE